MDREFLKNKAPLDPSNPDEFLEALRRFVEAGFSNWDILPDGDGITPTGEGEVATKTDIFLTIRGCADCALAQLELIRKINS